MAGAATYLKDKTGCSPLDYLLKRHARAPPPSSLAKEEDDFDDKPETFEDEKDNQIVPLPSGPHTALPDPTEVATTGEGGAPPVEAEFAMRGAASKRVVLRVADEGDGGGGSQTVCFEEGGEGFVQYVAMEGGVAALNDGDVLVELDGVNVFGKSVAEVGGGEGRGVRDLFRLICTLEH